jgi:hypothetical protein
LGGKNYPQQLHTHFMSTLIIRHELLQAIGELSERCLHHGAKWAAEQAVGLGHVDDAAAETVAASVVHNDEFMRYQLAKTYFELKEYYRVVDVLKECNGHKPMFLRGYALFLVGDCSFVVIFIVICISFDLVCVFSLLCALFYLYYLYICSLFCFVLFCFVLFFSFCLFSNHIKFIFLFFSYLFYLFLFPFLFFSFLFLSHLFFSYLIFSFLISSFLVFSFHCSISHLCGDDM